MKDKDGFIIEIKFADELKKAKKTAKEIEKEKKDGNIFKQRNNSSI